MADQTVHPKIGYKITFQQRYGALFSEREAVVRKWLCPWEGRRNSWIRAFLVPLFILSSYVFIDCKITEGNADMQCYGCLVLCCTIELLTFIGSMFR